MTENQNDVIMFTITRKQYQRYVQWQHELEERIAREQLESKQAWGQELSEVVVHVIRESLEQGEPNPYYGAIGGAYTFSFTATSMGTVVKVENEATGESLDLSDYDDW